MSVAETAAYDFSAVLEPDLQLVIDGDGMITLYDARKAVVDVHPTAVRDAIAT